MSTASPPAPALAGATLRPAALEAEFRARELAEDARTASVVASGYTLLLLTFVRSDVLLVGWTPTLGWLLAVRALHLGASAAMVVGMRRTRSPATLDRLALAWALSTSALNLAVLSTRAPTHHLPILLGVLMVAGYWTLLPNRFAFQGAAAFVAVAVEGVVLAAFRAPLPGTSLTLVGGGLGSAFLGGAFVSWRLHGARRRAFLELQRSEAAREELARALAEIRTLRGLVPICAACKAMRGPDGRWHELEEVLSRQTEAEFTHGICDRCVEKLYPVR